MAEETCQTSLTHAKQFGQSGSVEIGANIRELLLYPQFDERHQLSIVLQVGIALTLDIPFEQLTRHRDATTQLDVLLQAFREV